MATWPALSRGVPLVVAEQAARRPDTQLGALALTALELHRRLTQAQDERDRGRQHLAEAHRTIQALQVTALEDVNRMRSLIDDNLRLRAQLAQAQASAHGKGDTR